MRITIRRMKLRKIKKSWRSDGILEDQVLTGYKPQILPMISLSSILMVLEIRGTILGVAIIILYIIMVVLLDIEEEQQMLIPVLTGHRKRLMYKEFSEILVTTVLWKILADLMLLMQSKEILVLAITMELTEPTIQEMNKNRLMQHNLKKVLLNLHSKN
jgi:hypothetical protein